jgi:molybdate transport repressor ModE-like protein
MTSLDHRVLFARLTKYLRVRQLQLLLALQQSGSILQAAKMLHMSQSAATQALSELEKVLELQLFERHARGIRPTAAGQALIDAATAVMHTLEDTASFLVEISSGAKAALRLGVIPAATYALLGQRLTRFYDQHPDVLVDIQEGRGRELLSQLLNGQLDAVLCRAPLPLPAQCRFVPLACDHAVVVARHNHPLVGRGPVPLAQLAGNRWVLPSHNIAVRDIFDTVVRAELPDAAWFPISSMALSVLESLLSQPQALILMPHSMLPALDTSHGKFAVVPLAVDAQLLEIPPLGVVYTPATVPRLLGTFLPDLALEKT